MDVILLACEQVWKHWEPINEVIQGMEFLKSATKMEKFHYNYKFSFEFQTTAFAKDILLAHTGNFVVLCYIKMCPIIPLQKRFYRIAYTALQII